MCQRLEDKAESIEHRAWSQTTEDRRQTTEERISDFGMRIAKLGRHRAWGRGRDERDGRSGETGKREIKNSNFEIENWLLEF